ncbi:MAG: tyrosine-type recombinase/integrase [Pseudomonadota bacterium]
MTLTEARRKFIGHCESAVNLSRHTLRAYGGDLNDALQYLGRRELALVCKDDLRRYVRHLREHRGLKETTIKRRLATLKLLFRWARQEEIVEVNPFDSLNERIRLPRRLPRALDRADRGMLRQALAVRPRVDTFSEVRAKAAIHLLLDTGIRVGELAAILLSDISLASGHLVIHGKGNRQRLVYLLQPPLRRTMERYLALRQAVSTPAEQLFVTGNGGAVTPSRVRAELRALAQGAGIARHVTPHMLRHTCATQWLEAGLDIRHVQKLLGHQSISTTEIYTHVSDVGLREALGRAAGGLGR